MKIAILGAGGVGGYDGAVLARAGHAVQLLARGRPSGGNPPRRPAISPRRMAPPGPRHHRHRRPGGAPGRRAGRGDGEELRPRLNRPVAADLARHGATVLPLLQRGRRRRPARAARGSSPVAPGRARGHQRGADRARSGRAEEPVQPGGGRRARGRPLRARHDHRRGAWHPRASRRGPAPRCRSQLWRKLVFITTMASCCSLAHTSIGPLRAAPLGPQLLPGARDGRVGRGGPGDGHRLRGGRGEAGAR